MDYILIISLVTGIIGTLLSYLLAQSSRKKRETNRVLEALYITKFRKKAQKILSEETDLKSWLTYIDTISSSSPIHDLLPEVRKSQIDEVVEKQINEEVSQHTAALRKRLEAIEKRFPEKDSIDKIASVNDAILATRMEAIEESIRRIEKSLISRWDVAKIVFAIIGVLGVISSIIFGIISLLQSSSS